MVEPQEAASSFLCINDTTVMKRVNMKKGDMILEMCRCLKNVQIDGGRNAARLQYLGYLRRGWLCLLNVYGLFVSCLYAAYDI